MDNWRLVQGRVTKVGEHCWLEHEQRRSRDGVRLAYQWCPAAQETYYKILSVGEVFRYTNTREDYRLLRRNNHWITFFQLSDETKKTRKE